MPKKIIKIKEILMEPKILAETKILLIKIKVKDKLVTPDKIYHLLTKLVLKNQEIMEGDKVNTKQSHTTHKLL